MFKGFTKCSDRIINYLATLETKRYKHKEVLPEHVMIALLKDAGGVAYKIIGQIIDPVHLQMLLENHIARNTLANTKQEKTVRKEYKDIESFYNLRLKVSVSQRMHECLYTAIEEARLLQVNELDSFVLFVACCKEENSVFARLVGELGLTFENLHSYYHQFSKYITIYENELKTDEAYSKAHGGFNVSGKENFADAVLFDSGDDNTGSDSKGISFSSKNDEIKSAFMQKKILKRKPKENQDEDVLRFIIDLTEKMFHKKSALRGRDKEIHQVFRVLLRHYKNNPLLIGDPGVGKTAIVEEVARRICWGEAPLGLLHARILQIDIAAMTAGARFRGDFEERLCKVLEHVNRQSKIAPVIVFVDEFHHLIGAGLSSGTTMDAAGILKPALARGELCCIGATTIDEYQKHIETDKAFARRFMTITVDELSEESTYHALQSIKPMFERKHSVVFGDEAVREVVRLTKNYMSDRKLPDKAIDMMDEVGAFYNFKKTDTTPELINLYHSMHSLLEQAENNVESLDANTTAESSHAAAPFTFELNEKHNSHEGGKHKISYKNISATNEQLHEIITRRSSLQNALKILSSHTAVSINAQHVRTVMSEITGIPTDRMNLEKSSLIKTLSDNLEQNIIGQSHARRTLISAIRRSVVGLRDERRPVGSFLFVGPTGVGKTYTVRQLAKYLFGSEDMVTRFDMSDFSEQHAVSRLIGAPPGYVGFEDGGLLIKNVRRNPRQILLFDEIEKANSKIFDIFLQILDEGVLQGQRGDQADFRHCIIVLTCNVGADALFSKKSFGFSVGSEDDGQALIETKVKESLNKTFRPEFLNRLDEVVYFNALSPEHVSNIIDIMIAPLHHSLAKQNMRLSVTQSAKRFLQDTYFNAEYGARSIRKGIRVIEDSIAQSMLDKIISMGDEVIVSSHKDGFRIKSQRASRVHDAAVAAVERKTSLQEAVSA